MKQIILDYTPFVTRVALMDGSELRGFMVESMKYRGIVGNIYKGKVENVLSGMKAAFVNIGLERNGFLYTGDSLVDSNRLQDELPRKELHLAPGDIIMCQVVKDQFGTKGARLTTDVSIPGHFLVMIPNSDFIGISRKIEDPERRDILEALIKAVKPQNTGFIIRSAADKASDAEIAGEIKELQERWEEIQKSFKLAKEKELIYDDGSIFEKAIRDSFYEGVDRIVCNDEDVVKSLKDKVGGINIEFYNGERTIMNHFNLTKTINHLCDRRVDLDNGGYLIIDKAEALTVIDVNTGKYVGDKTLEDTVYKMNIEAAKAICKQIILRNICGIIIVDFIDMVDENHRISLVETFKELLKADPRKTTTVGMTELGLVEFTRKKTRLTLDDFMLQPCKSCSGGFEISDSQLVFMLRDELVDYLIASKHKHCYVGVHQDLFNIVFESKIFDKYIDGPWKERKVFLYVNPDLKRSKFDFSFKKPLDFEDSLVMLEMTEEKEEI